MRPTIIIGDIHGQTIWKEIVKLHDGHRFVFLGDYLDPYTPMPLDGLITNLSEIIEFKLEHPEDVVLLLGNHDMHYMTADMAPCTRYDRDIAKRASLIFRGNSGLFQYAFQDGKHLFTHAGVCHWWFLHDFKGNLRSANIAEQLNNPAPFQIPALCRAGVMRGNQEIVGHRTDGTPIIAVGGIFWADISEISADPLRGYTQYVGHNYIKEGPLRHVVKRANATIWFCDCLDGCGGYGIEE